MANRIEDVSKPVPRRSQDDPYGFAGTKLAGRYKIEELLGMGGMAVVYRGKHLTTARTVAVKILKPDLAYSDSGMIEAFLNEARATASLSHRNIVQVSDADRDEDGTTFLVMPYLKGRPLDEVMAEEEVMPLERVAGLFQQICDGVQHAHANGIIHRDLKPGNIMVIADGSVDEMAVILDFGIAKALTSTANVSRPVGTIYYASPEQLNKGASIDHRSDIYSLGVMLYQMLTGAVPFDDDSIEHIIYQKLHFQPPPLRQTRPDVPAPVEEVIQRALAKDPAHRFQHATEMSRAFWRAISLETGALAVDCVDAAARTPLAGAAVLVNGRLSGQTDIKGFWRQAGMTPRQYLLEVESPRYQPWRASLHVTAREEAVVTVEMQREPKGELVIACGISGAEVELDGRKAGKTDQTGRLFLDAIEEGSHTIRVFHSSFLPSETEAQVAIGEVSFHGVTLQPKPIPKTWKWLIPSALGGMLLAVLLIFAGKALLFEQNSGIHPVPTPSPTGQPETPTPVPSPSPVASPSAFPTPTVTVTPTPQSTPKPTPAVQTSPVQAKGFLNDLRPNCPPPVWPESIKKSGARGTIDLELLVNSNGRVEQARFKQATGDLRNQSGVEVAAEKAALGCRFSPSALKGRSLSGTYYFTFSQGKK